ncbi:maleylpyruvate isomerase family mycothiol-dependent enzyme [Ornithinimicrobium cryptoxanthini]|uniref:Maleylpyruvate isomerase family mycothiol-dependent enzyme n=1 Tax=Ornithinimicrobium cryptoxanthini TaxID=2934161 RepID=A0ABY4YN74_9MICO|nr:maleylpyruvate isomerase family mycothiol-dependent enzyme [Ornithinimicrobium cryptoxanthini]USQ77607.1 maleylpyruvate isomerase family mycothiol-dependent enzyme [Ornithinimicrobium cryptoxanthini]
MNDFMAAIAGESERFLEAIQVADPGAQVPTCPDWTTDDLLWHLTEVHSFWAEILRSGARTDDDVEAVEAAKPGRPQDRGAAMALFREQTAALLAQLAERDDGAPAWFWLETAQNVGSTRRMQAHEATMHRVDAELTAGLASAPIDPDLAADGIVHAITVMWAWWSTLPGFEFHPVGGDVTLAASDLDQAWQVQPGRWRGVGQSGKEYDEPGVTLADPSGADTTGTSPAAGSVTGTAEELMRWLWGRGPEPHLDGDPETLDALRSAQQAGMQ